MRASSLLQICAVILLVYLLYQCYRYHRSLQICQRIKKHLEITNRCMGANHSECVPPLYNFARRFRVSHNYHLFGCAIEKNFSSVFTAILCYLYNETAFVENNRTITGDMYHWRLCKTLNEYDTIAQFEQNFRLDLNIWAMVAIVRDPLERFVSGFAEKCLRTRVWRTHPERCNFCRRASSLVTSLSISDIYMNNHDNHSIKNLTCFMERLYDRMMRYTAGQQLDNTTMFDDRHFFPQNWRCEFNSHLRDYHILRFNTDNPSSFIEDMVTMFEKQNVTDTAIDHIETSLAFNRTEHSTRGTSEQQKVRRAILTSEYHLDLLVKMFYYDFVLFGFPIPEVQIAEDT